MKILLIRFSSLGDLVILSSVLEMLKNEPVEIYLLTYSSFASLYEHDSRLKGIIRMPKPYGLGDILRIIKTVRVHKFDAVFDLHRKILSIVIKALSGSKVKITYNNRHGERKKALKTKKIREIPVYELYAEPVKKVLGLNKKTPCPRLESVPMDMDLPEKYVVIAPGARHETKVWPYYSEFVIMFSDSHPEFRIVAVGDKGDRRFIRGLEGMVIDKVGKTTIPELLKIIEKSSLVVSNDSAAMHIGDAYGIPTIGIFGPTVPEFGFRPCNAKILEIKGLECRPCSLHGSTACPLKHFKCMRGISPRMVLKAAEDLLNSHKN